MADEQVVVLVVDDDPDARRLAVSSLQPEGYACVEAADAEAAWVLVAREPPALVLLDIGLPGRSGLELLAQVTAEAPDVAVVMVTGTGDSSSAVQAVQQGAYGYVTKPYVPRVLRIQVAGALERRRLRLENQVHRTHLSAVFENIGEGVITVDSQLRVTELNTAALNILGFPRKDLLERRLGDPPSTVFAPAAAVVERALQLRQPVHEEPMHLAGDRATVKVLQCSAAPLLGAEGECFGAILVLRDITHLTVLEQQLRQRHEYEELIGKSDAMQAIFALMRDVADTDTTVLIRGESGTGKELVATALQRTSPRADGPFVKVNCAALSEALLESELFGHVKGAFTGAVKDRMGRFEVANHGTIFLDEIGDMTAGMQSRLLRVLQEGAFERVGDSRPIRVDVRVIAATNQDLEAKMASGEFRSDVYYRLNVVRFNLPPLRDRREDMPFLVAHFRESLNGRMGKSIRAISDDAMDVLMRHSWPGNIRELHNCLERAFVVCHEPIIQLDHLPPEILTAGATPPTPATPASPLTPPPPAGHSPERVEVEAALTQAGWNVAKAARLLGVSRATLYHKLARFGLERPAD